MQHQKYFYKNYHYQNYYQKYNLIVTHDITTTLAPKKQHMSECVYLNYGKY